MITFVYIIHVSSETVFVQLLMGGCIPEAAGVRRDFVSQNDGAIGQLAELELEVYQVNINLFEVLFEDFVDLECVGSNLVQLLSGAQLHCQSVAKPQLTAW